MNCWAVLSGETPDLLFPASNAAIQELLPTVLTKLNPYSRASCISIAAKPKFPRFSNKASFVSKQGFFTLQTRLVWRQKKPCL